MPTILDLLKEGPPTMTEQKPPKIDEVAQIVLANAACPSALILRYRTEKKAQRVFKELKSAWLGGKGVVEAEGDMFSALIDLRTISNIALVVHSVRSKFTPFQ